jgi:hypothetical protein
MMSAAILLRKAKTSIDCTRWRVAQEWRVRLNACRLTLARQRAVLLHQKPEFRILCWYGRSANNLQQLIVALAHAERFRGTLAVDHELIATGALADFIDPFHYDFSPGRETDFVFGAVFFHYTEYSFNRRAFRRLVYRRGHSPRLDSLINKHYLEAHAKRIARDYLAPHLIEITSPWTALCRDDHVVVIHLRSGDVATLEGDFYLTNPLCYYQKLARLYPRALIVTEPGPAHPLLDSITRLFPHIDLVSGTVHQDFSLLRAAKQLASSGVGTFSVAAALLSENLRIFHCSNVYQDEHLNPTMLPSDRVRMQHFDDFVERWRRSDDRVTLLHNYLPNSSRPHSCGKC